MQIINDLAYARTVVERAFAAARQSADVALMEECIRLLRDLDRKRDDLLITTVLKQQQSA